MKILKWKGKEFELILFMQDEIMMCERNRDDTTYTVVIKVQNTGLIYIDDVQLEE